MALPPHPPKFINPWRIKKAELGETSLDVVQKSYEGNIETTFSLAVQGKTQKFVLVNSTLYFCSY